MMEEVKEDTKEDKAVVSDACEVPGVQGTRAHKWSWIWKDGHMTDQIRCNTCGVVRLNLNP